MKIKIFKNKKSFKKERPWINPNISWEIILCLSFVLIITAFIFGFNLFIQINKEFPVTGTGAGGQIKIVKKERIQKVLEYFTEREKKSTEILNSPAPIVDPSL